MHLLNCSFNYKLEDANRVLYSDFPAIDLIDHSNKIVVQVTSTLTSQKIYNSINKLKGLKDISPYKLKLSQSNIKINQFRHLTARSWYKNYEEKTFKEQL